jgi:hypothetical protein
MRACCKEESCKWVEGAVSRVKLPRYVFKISLTQATTFQAYVSNNVVHSDF